MSKRKKTAPYPKATLDHNGTKFRSKFEVAFAKQLDDIGVGWEYEPQDGKILWTPPPPRIRTYTPDFRIGRADRPQPTIIETKGYFRQGDAIKYREVAKQHPELDFRLVFMKADAKVRKGAKMTYRDWCAKHKIPCCSADEFTLEWLLEDYSER